jgi:hypothetical protein
MIKKHLFALLTACACTLVAHAQSDTANPQTAQEAPQAQKLLVRDWHPPRGQAAEEIAAVVKYQNTRGIRIGTFTVDKEFVETLDVQNSKIVNYDEAFLLNLSNNNIQYVTIKRRLDGSVDLQSTIVEGGEAQESAILKMLIDKGYKEPEKIEQPAVATSPIEAVSAPTEQFAKSAEWAQRMNMPSIDTKQSGDFILVILVIWIAWCVVVGVISVPVSLYKRFNSNAVVFENLTDAAYSTLSIYAFFIIAVSIAGITNSPVSSGIFALVALFFHIRWMKTVAKRANGKDGPYRWVGNARVLLSLFPWWALSTKVSVPVLKQGEDETNGEFDARVRAAERSATEIAKSNKQSLALFGMLVMLCIDQFRFEGLRSYFSRKDAF